MTRDAAKHSLDFLKSIDPKFLKGGLERQNEIMTQAAVLFPKLRRQQERYMQELVTDTAKEALTAADISVSDKKMILDNLEGFESAFGAVLRMSDDDKLTALALAETAFTISSLAPVSEEIMKKVRRKITENARTTKIANAQAREIEIGNAIIEICKREKWPHETLKAGDKWIDVHLREKIAKEMKMEPADLPTNRKLMGIVNLVKRGHFCQ